MEEVGPEEIAGVVSKWTGASGCLSWGRGPTATCVVRHARPGHAAESRVEGVDIACGGMAVLVVVVRLM